MPIDRSYRHLPGRTAQEQLLHQLVVAKGSSPFYPDEPRPQPIDTSVTATCMCCNPPRRFVGTAGKTAEEWLAAHVEGLTGRKATANARRRQAYAQQKATDPD
jgi:hypothetical protein